MGFRREAGRPPPRRGSDEMKTIDHMPLAGYSTSPTLRKLVPDCEKIVSKICLKVW